MTVKKNSADRFLQFEADCLFSLDHQYSGEHRNWRLSRFGTPTICIPDAVDVLADAVIAPTDKNASTFDANKLARKAKKVKGVLAERTVHAAFQRSTVGGVLLQSCKLNECYKKFENQGLEKGKLKDLKRLAGKEHFEIDSLLLHPQFGIVLFECKANNAQHDVTFKNHVKNALNQVRQSARRLAILFCLLTDAECITVPITYFLCFPGTKNRCQRANLVEFLLNDEVLSDKDRFKAFFNERFSTANLHSQLDYFTDSFFKRFIALLYGFRSVEIISPAINALTIYRMVSEQKAAHHLRQSERTKNFGLNTVFLTPEQLKIYEEALNPGKKCAIFGPPGSGKTILVKLLAIKAAMMPNRTTGNRVLIFLPNSTLRFNYEKFLTEIDEKMAAKITLCFEQADVEGNIDDDILSDEDIDGRWIPVGNNNSNRVIIAAITNDRFSHRSTLQEVKEKLMAKHGSGCHQYHLRTVMRNTGKIYEYCRKMAVEAQENSNAENIEALGHNISGSEVEEIEAENLHTACKEIAKRIEHLKIAPLAINDAASQSLKYRDFAVIVAHEPVYRNKELISDYLWSEGIQTGDGINTRTDYVALRHGGDVISLEWCIVFVVDSSHCYYSRKIISPLVSHSRAVCKLIAVRTVRCDRNPWRCPWFSTGLRTPHFTVGNRYTSLAAQARGTKSQFKYLSSRKWLILIVYLLSLFACISAMTGFFIFFHHLGKIISVILLPFLVGFSAGIRRSLLAQYRPDASQWFRIMTRCIIVALYLSGPLVTLVFAENFSEMMVIIGLQIIHCLVNEVITFARPERDEQYISLHYYFDNVPKKIPYFMWSCLEYMLLEAAAALFAQVSNLLVGKCLFVLLSLRLTVICVSEESIIMSAEIVSVIQMFENMIWS